MKKPKPLDISAEVVAGDIEWLFTNNEAGLSGYAEMFSDAPEQQEYWADKHSITAKGTTVRLVVGGCEFKITVEKV